MSLLYLYGSPRDLARTRRPRYHAILLQRCSHALQGAPSALATTARRCRLLRKSRINCWRCTCRIQKCCRLSYHFFGMVRKAMLELTPIHDEQYFRQCAIYEHLVCSRSYSALQQLPGNRPWRHEMPEIRVNCCKSSRSEAEIIVSGRPHACLLAVSELRYRHASVHRKSIIHRQMFLD